MLENLLPVAFEMVGVLETPAARNQLRKLCLALLERPIPRFNQAGAVAHETAGLRKLAPFVNRRDGHGARPAKRFARAGC